MPTRRETLITQINWRLKKLNEKQLLTLRGWMDENRTYTEVERVYATRWDC